jgi:hypothetical protein
MISIDKCNDILGLPPNASYEEAKAAYRALAAILHPDKHTHNERLKNVATEKFKQLQNAWSELELYYKTGMVERIRQEEHGRTAQDMANAERQREAALRAEVERRAEERRVAEDKSKSYTCPMCGVVNKVLGGKSIDNSRCGACKMPLNKKYAMDQLALEEWHRKKEIATEQSDKRNRKQLIASLIITTIMYFILIIYSGQWGLLITFFTVLPVWFFVRCGCYLLFD